MDEKAPELIGELRKIQYFILIQAIAIALLLTAISILAHQYFRYRRIKRLYRADYARKSFIKGISRFLLIMPEYKSRRYRNTEGLIINSGLRISVEGFYLIKTLIFIFGLVFLLSIQTTNTFIRYDEIIRDLNMGKTLIDAAEEPDAHALQLEKDVFSHIERSLPKKEVTLKELTDEKNSRMFIDYIEIQISNKWNALGEYAGEMAERMYRKLIRIRAIETDYLIYLTSLGLAIILYFIPDVIGHVKIRLIEDKRDWEILNYIYVFSMFGRMPPFNIKNVLSNILVISDIYKPMINEALNNIKSGKGEGAFEDLLRKVESQELYELFEFMSLSMSTGLLNIVDNIDEMAVSQLKWLEIKSIKRRKSKQVIAMVPVVLVMLVSAVYFSYSLSTLSDPMNFIK
ncbi:MAG: hypothetical protein VB106_02940 [Clostridiaceae bacterium]|nr:hypothetical protein [Clostridiaceae bacterium]